MGDPFAPAGNPFGEDTTYTEVDTTYQPPSIYQPSGGAWNSSALTGDDLSLRALEEEELDTEPFTAAHLAAANNGVVPSALPAGPSGRAEPATLAFTETTAAVSPVSGKLGPAPVPAAAPRSGLAPDTALLLVAGAASSALPSLQHSRSAPAGLGAEEDPSKFGFWNIKRYRTHFNVDTQDVLARIFRAVALFFRGDFLESVPNADLYGPFWVATTLVFVSAATGNFASWLAWQRGAQGGEKRDGGWYYDVDKVGGSMGLFYGYVGVIGLMLWGVLRWFKAGVTLAQVWCTYGYALAVYIPIACICILPVEAMRWAVLGAATATSGLFLLLTFRRPILDSAGPKALPLLLVLGALHLGLGLALKLYFFNYAA